MSNIQLHLGDCLEVMRGMADSSVDAVVTDPPAGISFMGKEWDADKGGRAVWVGWLSSVMAECLRVLKPGGHAFVWALPRTSHWTACAIEDAGFEIRDVITHIQGSGFPKSHDVSKAIDRMAGAERPDSVSGGHIGVSTHGGDGPNENEHRLPHVIGKGTIARGTPATPEAAQWEGWGTALKPATEHWILARKPLQGTVAQNVLAWGTGALNVDGGRVGYADGDVVPSSRHNVTIGGNGIYGGGVAAVTGGHTQGRWPANVLLSHSAECKQVGVKRVKTGLAYEPEPKEMRRSIYGKTGTLGRIEGYADPNGLETVEAWECAPDCPVAELDRQSGVLSSGARNGKNGPQDSLDYSAFKGNNTSNAWQSDTGSASRFFQTFEPEYNAPFLYVAKASRSERNAGCEGLPEQRSVDDDWVSESRKNAPSGGQPSPQSNHHPTVKPIKLMRYLCRLITPPNGTVLDPFMGSGSTGVAAMQEGFGFVGIEREAEYLAIAQKRIEAAQAAPQQLEMAV